MKTRWSYWQSIHCVIARLSLLGGQPCSAESRSRHAAQCSDWPSRRFNLTAISRSAHRDARASRMEFETINMAAPCSLACYPDDISEKYLPYELTLRQRQRADLFSREQYLHKVKLSSQGSVYNVDARCFRSQQKTEDPHRVCLSVNGITKRATEAYCTCKAG